MIGEEKKMLVIDVADKAVLEKRRLKEEIEKKVHLARMTQLEKTEANIKVLEANRKVIIRFGLFLVGRSNWLV